MLADLTAEYLRSVLKYDPETGEFTWLRHATKPAMNGTKAGCRGRAEISIRVMYKIYKAHRLAWLYMTGEWPPSLIDHKDSDPYNNQWSNLRLANFKENSRNRKPVLSRSGLKGVSRCRKKWKAAIFIDGKIVHLGMFESATDAHQAYVSAAKQHYGDFARCQ